MHNSYKDIRDRIPDEPIWWDEVGVPRYCKFTPDDRHATYSSDEVALVEIACQGCGHRFKVAFSYGELDGLWNKYEVRPLSEWIKEGLLHYGDPPNIGCCDAGPTMNCDDLRVLEFWRCDKETFKWIRCPELEITFMF